MSTPSEKPHIVIPKTRGQWSGWCVHYRSQMNDTCEAGVSFESVRNQIEYTSQNEGEKHVSTCTRAMPCFKHENPLSDGCSKCRFPTPEEVEEHHAVIDRHIDEITTARAAIVAHTGGAKGVSGQIKCPCCGGAELIYAVSGYNGHIRARCQTPDCVSWIE